MLESHLYVCSFPSINEKDNLFTYDCSLAKDFPILLNIVQVEMDHSGQNMMEFNLFCVGVLTLYMQ
jgi:hypothetical protein